jgi:CheY-like chemotaxis protein
VKQCGGTIRLESVSGRGTTVHVWLPRAEPEPETLTEGRRESATAEPLRGSVLVVDDDPDVRAVAVEVLRSTGYHVEEAASGHEALEILDRQIPVDIALVDYAMPHMSGSQFMAAAHQRRSDLPAVFITGYADPQELTNDPDAVIVKKPYRASELLRVIQDTLTRNGNSPGKAKVIPIRSKVGSHPV